jgi:prepilin-type N-terminal cleavage/methylation domain-containing protein
MSSSNIYRRRSRSGFTLTELLIGITIIGLLVGMLVVAGAPAISRAREFAVTNEMTQMSQAIENFKTKYGFYPPSFEQFKRTVNTGDTTDLAIIAAEANQILPYLNKISPGHQEMSASPNGGGRTRLMDWWENVGCNLDQTTSLQFWLSGLCHNKQFPLTGTGMGSVYVPVGYNVDVYVDGSEIPGGLEREVFFDFDTQRLIPVDILNGSVTTRPISQFIMEHGKTNGDLFYVYRDSESYLPVAQPNASHLDPNSRMATPVAGPPIPNYANAAYPAYLSSANHRGLAYHTYEDTVNGSLKPTFLNPNTFQLISFGLDGDPGLPDSGLSELRGLISDRRTGNPIGIQGLASDDNLANFAEGRLDKFKNERELE